MRIALLILCLLAALPARASEPVRPVTIADGFEHPWSVAFLPDNEFLVTERGGKLWRVGLGGARTEIRGLPGNIVARRQGGLFDVVLHPDFANNKLVYLSYNGKGEGGSGTEVARAVLNGDRLRDLEIIFRAAPKMRSDVHFGGRLLFAPDGKLLVTLGDRMHMDGAQDKNTDWGGILRLNDDGTVPADNPFVNDKAARPALYSFGHRNVQGIALAPDGSVWATEHGPQGGDELNIIRPGVNYGWPVITHGIDYDDSVISEKTAMDGMEQPVTYWRPSIAPSGLAVYTSDKYPGWTGDIFTGALAGTHLRRLDMKGKEVGMQEVLLSTLEQRIRDVRQGPDGLLYVLTDAANGRLIRLDPAR